MSYPNASLTYRPRKMELQEFRSLLGSGFTIEPSLGRKPKFEVSFRVVGRQLLLAIKTTPIRIERSVQSIVAERLDHVLMMIVHEGAVRVESEGRATRLESGSVLLTSLGTPSIIHTGEAELQITILPRRHLTQIPVGDAGDELIGINKTPSSVLAWSELFHAIHRLPERLRSEDSAAFDLALMNAAVPIFMKVRETRAPQANKRDLHARILQHIREKLNDPNLGPDKIASALKVSRSQLYRAFGAEPQGLKAYIETQRVREASLLLARGGLSVEEVGRRMGFRNLRQFSAAFKRQYGMTPEVARRTALDFSMIEEKSGGFLPRIWRNL